MFLDRSVRFLLICLSFLLGVAPVAAVCPESCILYADPLCSTVPVRYGSTGGGHGSGPGYGRYELPLGSAEAGAYSNGRYGGYAEVKARDDFRVVGIPAGTPLTIFAEWNFRVFGSLRGAFGAVGIGRGDEASQRREFFYGGEPKFSEEGTLVEPIVVNAGDEFRLTTTVTAAAGDGGAGAVGALSFSGLPGGARVESCQGFVQDVPVPVAARSWGSVKAHYR
jgi:hypothetical protein